MTQQLHIVDAPTTDQTQETIDSGSFEIETPDFYDDATEPPWKDYGRGVGAFLKALLPAVEKDEFLDDRPRVHHFKQLEELRLVDELETDRTDDVDLAALFVLPDESLVFVGSDPTAKDARPLFGFVIEPFAPIPAPTTAQEALDLLRPEEIRAAFETGEEPARQGEWWLLPTSQVPLEVPYRPGVNSRPYGPSPLGNHVPREWGMTASADEFMSGVRDLVDELPSSIETPPEVIEWVHRQHRRRPVPDHAPAWDEIQSIAGEILVRGTLRHREDDHYVENLGEQWHRAETHDMDVYTADEFDRVVLD